MGEQINYSDLLKQFMLQRRPYISVADVLDCLYKNFLSSTGLTPAEVAPFDFTLLKTKPNGIETFRWFLGYDANKFYHILKYKEVFTRHVDLVFSNIGKNPRLATFYKKVLENPAKFDELDFLTAVFHLTYRFVIPAGVFNVGLIHKEHKQKNRDYYFAKLCTDEQHDNSNLPPLQIGENLPIPQVTDEFYTTCYKQYESFYTNWIYTIQGIAFLKKEYNIFHLYFPVYDGMIPQQSSLRGYLGLFFNNEESRNIGLEFFTKQNRGFFRNISEAYIKGIHNNIVDGYKEDHIIADPVEYWCDNLPSMHHWGKIELLHQENFSEIFRVEASHCKISIQRLLERKAVAMYVDSAISDKYTNTVLDLEIPAIIERKMPLTEDSAYLRKRIRELTQLLDELLRERYIKMNEERIKNAARKSAVAAVMSRNMSHNIGSHVFARLCTTEDFDSKKNRHTFSKISAFNAFLRTRMDFLADLSTSVPTVASTLRLYRDSMGYFKPAYADEEEFSWQELLLDYISGIDDLKSQNIQLRFLYHGKEVNLESPESDPVFASPNGLLGTHALYIILENIIRNSAKHAYDKDAHEKLEIIFQIEDSLNDENLLEVCIFDQLGNADSVIEEKGKLIDYLNYMLEASILDDDGNLRGVAWGVLEMKICAAYLRKISSEKLDAPYNPPLLQAVSVDGNLGYKFYLARPNEILIVDSNSHFPNKDDLNIAIKSHGFKIVTGKEFEKELHSNIEHNFLILVNPSHSLLDIVCRNFKALPTRIFTTDQSNSQFPYIELAELKSALLDPASRSLVLSNIIWPLWNQHLKSNASLFIRPEETNIVAKWQIDGFSEASIDPKDIFHLDKHKKYIVYDRHGLINQQFESTLKEKILQEQILYYEQVQHKQPTHFIIDNVPSNGLINNILIHELCETGLTKVILLDERIQKKIEESEEDGRKLKDILENMNISSPLKSEINLDAPRNYCPELTAWLDQNLENTTFLVVHLGILEKLYKDNVSAMDVKFQQLESQFPHLNIVIISGRGLPSTIRRLQTRFIQYSQVARYILEERSKYHLCKVLAAARRSLA